MRVYFYYVVADKHKKRFENRIIFHRFKPIFENHKVGEIITLANRAGYPAQYLMYIGCADFKHDQDLMTQIYDVTKKMVREVVWGNNKEVMYKTRKFTGDENGK